eukprot:364591-Rhodomonas_salina.1
MLLLIWYPPPRPQLHPTHSLLLTTFLSLQCACLCGSEVGYACAAVRCAVCGTEIGHSGRRSKEQAVKDAVAEVPAPLSPSAHPVPPSI